MPSNNVCVLNCKTGSSARKNLGPSAHMSPTLKSVERARAGAKTRAGMFLYTDAASERKERKRLIHIPARTFFFSLPLPRVIPGRRSGSLSAAQPRLASLPPRLPRVIHSLHLGPSPPAGPYTLCLALAEATGGAAPLLLLGLCPPSLQHQQQHHQRRLSPSYKRAEETGQPPRKDPRGACGSLAGEGGRSRSLRTRSNYREKRPLNRARRLAPPCRELRGSQEAGSERAEEAAAVSGTLARRPVAA